MTRQVRWIARHGSEALLEGYWRLKSMRGGCPWECVARSATERRTKADGSPPLDFGGAYRRGLLGVGLNSSRWVGERIESSGTAGRQRQPSGSFDHVAQAEATASHAAM